MKKRRFRTPYSAASSFRFMLVSYISGVQSLNFWLTCNPKWTSFGHFTPILIVQLISIGSIAIVVIIASITTIVCFNFCWAIFAPNNLNGNDNRFWNHRNIAQRTAAKQIGKMMYCPIAWMISGVMLFSSVVEQFQRIPSQ